MADLTEIANIALIELGAQVITEIGEGSDNANTLKSNFNSVRDVVLRSHPWNCASARKLIAADPTQPNFGYAYRYALPTDPYCLRVVKVNGNKVAWNVEGRWILTDVAGPIEVQYIARPKTPEELDPMLADVIGLSLAARCAQRIANSKTKKEKAEAAAERALKSARSVDGQEGTPDQPAESELYLSRFSS